MSERDLFLHTWARERVTTLKVLRAYPEAHATLKPAERSKPANELAWMFCMEQRLLMSGAASGAIDRSRLAPAPATFTEIAATYEQEAPAIVALVEAMTDADWNGDIEWMLGPHQPGKFRRGDLLWLALHDMIHHRGQLSMYIRIAGASLPSIYGPTADEPWR